MLYETYDQLMRDAEYAPKPADLPTVKVLGLPLVDATPDTVIPHLLQARRKTVCFLNAHCANMRATSWTYEAALKRADHILPDGIGIELAARMTGQRLKANLNGTDLVPGLLREAAQQGLSVYLLGGTPGTALAAANRLVSDIPHLRVAGVRDGFGDVENAWDAIDDINLSGADIVLVAMGVPRQEIWIDQYRDRINARLVMGVGALFDFLAGNVRRAPSIVRKARMEWGWRLAMEPRRLAKRYLVGNVTFMARSAAYALRSTTRTEKQQRALDITVSVAALAVLGLPMLVVAGLVRLDSRGPAFFKQVRVGKNGRTFEVYKFRSMHVDAEARRQALLAMSDREGVCFKSRNDPRVTRIGRFLRRLSLDELPQILNVLKGDMSIVGPRPALPEEVAAYPERALGRLSVKPGITGLWQVSGRANIGFDKMIDLDLAYVRSRSVLLDILLILLTVQAVVSGRGAY